MKTIRESTEYTLIVERSEFHAYLLPISSEAEAQQQLSAIRRLHNKARHCCYAYRLRDTQKSSDDGEPKGTAGRPLLELLLREDLSQALVVVVRYFGGIKLGAGRLLRTYVEAAKNAMQAAVVLQEVILHQYQLSVDLRLYNALERLLNQLDAKVETVDFAEQAWLKVTSEQEIAANLMQGMQGRLQIVKLEDQETFKEV